MHYVAVKYALLFEQLNARKQDAKKRQRKTSRGTDNKVHYLSMVNKFYLARTVTVKKSWNPRL